ncbi:cobalt-precorrin-5B (C(1))-methyltransferase CbiD [Thermosynechococcus sp. HY213]|uniref:cobalt-precorrin-5B (C(1))-methyltransferase CbiD n=1 Tax=Thermosynechococcus sp. HY213 TaxID=3074104 RepID=UPI00285838B7|nr:cobalt-precorrin-5B (C(1))-methyltransferase CbiD [Thermosynechococcus sp. HY213]MDR7920790.1 cobalt-precorrin-5B (C(1))-methyltransferase CbiD [Thermosynechococcus sp. HY213]
MGYTLPVFAAAAAVAALRCLTEGTCPKEITLALLRPNRCETFRIAQGACLDAQQALAITYSEPSDPLDLTRHTPIWAWVRWQDLATAPKIHIEGGFGVGRDRATGEAAIYRYARLLLTTNLLLYCPKERAIAVTILLPQGRDLAERTSNAAFGIVEGLSLLGTTALAQPLTASEQLDRYREDLAQKAAKSPILVFCIGENGLQVAQQLQIPPSLCVKTANWLGPMLVAAAQHKVQQLLLLGYHGKLIKLAGGIFHTHHHLADARQEILTAFCALAGLDPEILHQVWQAPTVEAALKFLATMAPQALPEILSHIANRIDERAITYIHAHCAAPMGRSLQVGCALFGRDRQIVAISEAGNLILTRIRLY